MTSVAMVVAMVPLLTAVGPGAVPGLVDPEQAYPHLATVLLPPAVAGILLAAIISASPSTRAQSVSGLG